VVQNVVIFPGGSLEVGLHASANIELKIHILNVHKCYDYATAHEGDHSLEGPTASTDYKTLFGYAWVLLPPSSTCPDASSFKRKMGQLVSL
jgi:hypothetical protein